MSIVYNPHDVFVVQRNSTSSSFEEKVLSSSPNTLFFFDSASNVVALPSSSISSGTALSSSYSTTSSFALNISETSSYALFAESSSFSPGSISSSYALTSKSASLSVSSSYALVSNSSSYTLSASYLNSGANIYLNNSYIYSNTSASAPPEQIEGRIWWDKISHTYAIDELESSLQIGQENYIRAIAGEYIPNGTAVYVSGADLDPDDPSTKLPIVYLSIADGTGTKNGVVGISTQEILTGNRGFITTQGIVNDLDTSAFFDGDPVFLSDTISGSFTNIIPLYPAEKVVIGSVLYSNAGLGRILVGLSTSPYREIFSVGAIDPPTLSNTGSIVNVGSTRVNICTTADGKGVIKSYMMLTSSFNVTSSFLDVQYVVANYNSGSPVYELDTTLENVDEIQRTVVASFTMGTAGNISYVDWDASGLLLSNKQNHRIIHLWGAQRADGLALTTSGSHILISSGNGFLGVKELTFTTASTENPGQFALLAHSASVWSGSLINGWINTIYDDGDNLHSLSASKFTVNYVWRGIGSLNRAQIILGSQYDSYADAVESIMPAPPAELQNISILVGRIVTKQGATASLLVESAFTTIFSVAGVTTHNLLNGLQGGNTVNEFYHLTAADYALRNSASYIIPGATLQIVSGSANTQSSYIEPYNIPTVPYNPPYKEGRMFYDKDYSNWVYYTDQNFKLHIGKECIWRIYNPNGSTLTTGTPVYLSGSTNLLDPDVYPAIADGTNIKSDVVGVIRYDTPSGQTGYVIQAGVIHNLDMTGFIIGDPIFLSSTVLGGLTKIEPGQPYESVRIGNCQVGGVNGSLVISPVFKLPPVIAYSGMTSVPTITSNGSGLIYISTGSVNLYSTPTGYGGVLGYPVLAKTMSLTTGSTNYVIVEISNSLATYNITTDSTYVNGISIVRVATLDIYQENTSSWDVHQFNVGIIGLALSNRINNKDIRLYGYQREVGLTLYTTGSSGRFGITEGTIWYGPNSHVVSIFETTLDEYYTYLFVSTASYGTSSWLQTTQSVYENLYYNNSSSGLVPLTSGSWTVNYVYRLMGTADEAAIVLSSEQFATELEASNNATTPPNLPSTIADMGLLVGRFIVQSGSYVPTIESAFSNIFTPAVVTNHESLTGLQGGEGGGHYHMTFADYAGTGTGVMVRKNNATMSSVKFESSTPGHIPYWNTQQQLTLTGSVQVINNKYVTINSASVTVGAEEALLVQQINTSSVLAIGAYGTVNNFFQIYIQNNSSGSEASSDICATADIGDQDHYWLDMGIASSGMNDSRWPWLQPLDGYLEIEGGNLWLATMTTHSIKFAFNNTASTNYADSTGFYLSGSFFGTGSLSDVSFFGTASWAKSSSWSPNQGATTLYTGSTFNITSSWANNAITSSHTLYAENSPATTLYTGSTFNITSSWSNNSVSSSWAPTSPPGTTLFTASTYQITSSWSNNSVSASWAPFTDTGTTLYTASTYQITSSWAVNSSTSSFLTRNRTYEVTSSWSVSSSYAITSSRAITSSYALTASYVNDTVMVILPISYSTQLLTGIPLPLSFSINPGESWLCDAYLTAQSSNNRGLKHIISSSVINPGGQVDGWIWSPTSAITTQTILRYNALNTLNATAVHTQANVAGQSLIHFCIMNVLTSSVISIGIASTNTADTVQVHSMSYMIAQKVR